MSETLIHDNDDTTDLGASEHSSALDVLSSWYGGLSGAVHTHTSEVVTTAALGEVDDCSSARDEMLTWAAQVLQAHLYAAGPVLLDRGAELTSARALVEALRADQSRLTSLIAALAEAPTLTHAAAQAMALQTMVDRYLGAESRQLLAALVDAQIPLPQVVTELQQRLSEYVPVEPSAGGGGCGGDCGSCQCGAD